jgi:purine-binding chemotaxis protein CheW
VPRCKNMTTTSEQFETRSRPASLLAGKYLTFCLGTESYGLPVIKVREIIRFVSPTHVPQMPPHVEGVINLRGKIIPVLNLRRKFGLPPTPVTERTCTVVVKVGAGNQPGGLIGLVVDGVEEVAQISTLDLEAPPDFGPQADTHHILGMAKVKGAIKTLLDLDRIVSTETLDASNLQFEPAA